MQRLTLLLALSAVSCTAASTIEGRRDAADKEDAANDSRFILVYDGPGARADGKATADGPSPARDSTTPTPDAPVADPCAGVTCSGHGDCVVVAGQPSCECEYTYKPDGLNCIPACTGVTCPDGKTCIPGHHGITDPLCVDTCDCSNCGNCDAGDIPSYGVAYCGNPDGSPATMACNKPCPNNGTCIPFATPICWSGQGCYSL